MHKVFFIKDIINSPNAILHSQGLAVYQHIKIFYDEQYASHKAGVYLDEQIRQGKVLMNFEGINGLTSAFIHSGVGKLVALTLENPEYAYLKFMVVGHFPNNIQKLILEAVKVVLDSHYKKLKEDGILLPHESPTKRT